MIGAFVLFAVGGYLLGSIPTGLLLGRLIKGVDIRQYGSGKIGTTNTLRTLGLGPAVAVLVGDVLKGALPVLAARLLTGDAGVQVAAALGAIAGHDWPLYAGFRGGRGVATTFGALVAMLPLLAAALLLLGGVLLLAFRYASLMSVAGTVIAVVVIVGLALAGRVPRAYIVFALTAGPLIVALHRENIARLLAGTEPKLGQGGARRADPKAGTPGRAERRRPVGSRR
jgi:glycerol-3-phosphate acyltransferase PlsY